MKKLLLIGVVLVGFYQVAAPYHVKTNMPGVAPVARAAMVDIPYDCHLAAIGIASYNSVMLDYYGELRGTVPDTGAEALVRSKIDRARELAGDKGREYVAHGCKGESDQVLQENIKDYIKE